MPNATSPPDGLLTYEQARRYLGCSLRTIKERKLSGDLAFVPVGERGVRFTRADLDDWIARNRVPSRHEDRRAS